MHSIFRSLGRAISWHRRLLAALAAATCVLSLILALRPAEPASAPVVVTTRLVAGGTELTAEDLTIARLPRGLIPDEAIAAPESLIGRTLAAPLTKGSVVTALSTVSARITKAGSNNVLTPVRFADPDVVALIAVGDVVDVLAASETGTSILAHDARVAAIPAPPRTSGLGASDSRGQLVVLEVPPDTAAALARAASSSRLALALK